MKCRISFRTVENISMQVNGSPPNVNKSGHDLVNASVVVAVA